MKFSQQRAIDKEAKKRAEELHEHLQDIAHKIADDQREWLDKQMADLFPPELYQAGLHGDMEREIEEYLDKHKIRLTWIPDRQSIRIMVGDVIYSQFVAQLSVDGHPISLTSGQASPSNN